uniref:Acyl-CoA synthetase family member 2, mitochondrial n=1 Tax=Rhabditophanes sp. KR3021 TaxID=114890 RepID=A0AC35TSQ9_9BILA
MGECSNRVTTQTLELTASDTIPIPPPIAKPSSDTNNNTLLGMASYTHGASNTPLMFTTIGKILRNVAGEIPDKQFVIFKRESQRKTYGQVLEDSEKLALGLLHLGLCQGDRIGIWAPNDYIWVVTQFAAALAGLVLVNVNPSYQTEELKYALMKVGIKAIIAPPDFKKSNYYNIISEIIPQIREGAIGVGEVESEEFPDFRHLIIYNGGSGGFKGAWNYDHITQLGTGEDKKKLTLIEADISPDDAANIQYTSGTTGSPKGATLSHHNILNNAMFVGVRAGYQNTNAIICIPNPLYHCFGCVMGVLAALIHHQTCVFPAPSFEPLAALEAIHEESCTAVYGTPTMYIDMINHPKFKDYNYSSIKSGIVAGAPCPIALCQRLVTEMGMEDLAVCYGTTETSPVSYMSLLRDAPEYRIQSVGYVMDHLESMLIDEKGKVVSRGEKGEILVRGYSVMLCYWGSEEQTKKDITPDRWYHTGDIGVMHGDGTVTIVGRSKDMIVRGGENLYPTEIEQFLFRHPQVENVQVVGVPDARMGEAVCAWIQQKDHFPGAEQLTEASVKEYCQGKIAYFKIPRYILFKKEKDFPKTVTGKIKKFEIKQKSTIQLGLQNVSYHYTEFY